MTLAAAARTAAIGSLLALGACAGEREAGRDIVWESERAAPSATAETEAAAATAPGLDGDGCREYTQTVRIGGEEQQAYGRACLQPDGSWRIHAPGAPAPGPAAAQAVPAYRYAYPPYYYAPPAFFGSAFLFSSRHHHHHHRHRHGHGHFRHRR